MDNMTWGYYKFTKDYKCKGILIKEESILPIKKAKIGGLITEYVGFNNYSFFDVNSYYGKHYGKVIER